MSTLRYVLKRFVLSLFTIFLVSVLTFAFIHILPGSVANMILGKQATPAKIAQVKQQLGLNRPLYMQYLSWIGGFVTGHLGTSFIYGDSVSSLVLTRLPRSIYLAAAAVTIAVVTAIPMGVAASVRQNGVTDLGVSLFAFAGISVPNFFWSLVFILVFGVELGWLPSGGYVPPTQDFVGFLQHLALPALALGWSLMAYITRMTRSSMLEVFNENYITTAKAKGVERRDIVFTHALRNALIPVLTVIAFQIGYAFGGVIIIEQIFSWPGIGSLTFQAILQHDIPVIQAGVIVITAVFVGSNFVVDLLYSVVDPRIRYGGESA